MSPRLDPVLKLYENCPVLLAENANVRKGLANGTRALVKKIVLKDGKEPSFVAYGNHIVQGVVASQVDHILCQHKKPRKDGEDLFKVKCRDFTFEAILPIPSTLALSLDDAETVRMKASQFPLLLNNATTGHKLQGATIDRIFVHCWKYKKNWPYVVLSRVKTLSGLYLRHKLSNNPKKYEVPKGYKKMMHDMSQRRPLYWTTEEYNDIFN